MTDHETLIALWAGQPEADLTADITEIITKVGTDNPAALADEIAHVVMQHGTPFTDALPPATMLVYLDDLPGHTLPGKTAQVGGSAGLRKVGTGWQWWDTSYGGRWLDLTIVDHMVEVLAPVPVVEAADEVRRDERR